MKVFWSIIACLAILTAGLLVASRDKDAPPSDAAIQPAELSSERVSSAHSEADKPLNATGPVESQATTPTSLKVTPDEIAPPPAPGDDAPPQDPDRFRPPPPQTKEANEQQVDSTNSDEAVSPLTPNAPAEITIVEPKVEMKPSDADGEALLKELQVGASPEEATAAAPEAEASIPPEVDLKTTENNPADSKPVETPIVESANSNADSQTSTQVSATAAAEDSPVPNRDPTKPEIVPSTFVKREDGSTLVDGRFVMRGKGTKADPYQVSWDMLVASSEMYDPRADKLKLPERVIMLNGKYVKVVGYVAFPIAADGPDQMLAMLNAWDGCCIGVPPTPYDAVEVRLKEAATAEQMMMNWGSVTGRFKVEPYLATNWLLGLYLMDDAELTAESM